MREVRCRLGEEEERKVNREEGGEGRGQRKQVSSRRSRQQHEEEDIQMILIPPMRAMARRMCPRLARPSESVGPGVEASVLHTLTTAVRGQPSARAALALLGV